MAAAPNPRMFTATELVSRDITAFQPPTRLPLLLMHRYSACNQHSMRAAATAAENAAAAAAAADRMEHDRQLIESGSALMLMSFRWCQDAAIGD